MDVNIQHKEEKPLLHRTDARVRIAYEGATPQRTALQSSIAGAMKAQPGNVIVRRIATEFGNQAAIVDVSVYKDSKALEQFEPVHMKKRHGLDKKEEPAAEAAAEKSE
jgi:ribosomal protein S24E